MIDGESREGIGEEEEVKEVEEISKESSIHESAATSTEIDG